MWLESRSSPLTTVRLPLFIFLFQSETPDCGGNIEKKKCHFLSAVIPYTTDARAEAAARNPQLRLMFRLVHFHLLRDGDDNGGAYALFPVTFWPPSRV